VALISNSIRRRLPFVRHDAIRVTQLRVAPELFSFIFFNVKSRALRAVLNSVFAATANSIPLTRGGWGKEDMIMLHKLCEYILYLYLCVCVYFCEKVSKVYAYLCTAESYYYPSSYTLKQMRSVRSCSFYIFH